MIGMLSNIYDRLYFILESVRKVEERFDILERSVGKSRLKRLDTFYGEREKRFGGLFKRHDKD